MKKAIKFKIFGSLFQDLQKVNLIYRYWKDEIVSEDD